MHDVSTHRRPYHVVTNQLVRLLRRIEGHSDHRREPLNEIQADIPALEILNDIRKLLFAVR